MNFVTKFPDLHVPKLMSYIKVEACNDVAVPDLL